MTEERLKQVYAEVDDLGRVLSLMLGSFFPNTVLAACLTLVVLQVLQKTDGSNEYINHHTNYSRDYEFPCLSPVGYTGTISGLATNFNPQGYVFMFVTIVVQAVVVLKEMPSLGGYSQVPWTFYSQCMLVRLAVGMTVITAVIPDFAEGIHGEL